MGRNKWTCKDLQCGSFEASVKILEEIQQKNNETCRFHTPTKYHQKVLESTYFVRNKDSAQFFPQLQIPRPTFPPGPVLATVRSPELIVAVLDSARVSCGCTAARLSSIPQDEENTASLFLMEADGSS